MSLYINRSNNYGMRIVCKCGEDIVIKWNVIDGYVKGVMIDANREVKVNRINKEPANEREDFGNHDEIGTSSYKSGAYQDDVYRPSNQSFE